MKVGWFRQKQTFAGAGGRAARVVFPNQKVVMTESNAREFQAQSFVVSEEAPPLRSWRNDADLDGKSLLLIRPGGVGDLLMMTPAIRQTRQHYPKARIVACTFATLASTLRGNPDVDAIVEYPPLLEEFENYDYHVDFEGVIEDNAEAEMTPGIDLLARWMGIDLDGISRRPVFELSDEERWSARYKPKPLREKRGWWVMLQAAASSRIRTWPQEQAAKVALALVVKGAEVFVTGHPTEWGRWQRTYHDGKPLYLQPPLGLHNLTGQTKDLRALAAIMEKMDLVISPDSSSVHLAAALGIPNLALYGPFPPKLRVSYYEKCLAIQGEAECAPCFAHGMALPCGRKTCLAMEAIKPEHVATLAVTMLMDAGAERARGAA